MNEAELFDKLQKISKPYKKQNETTETLDDYCKICNNPLTFYKYNKECMQCGYQQNLGKTYNIENHVSNCTTKELEQKVLINVSIPNTSSRTYLSEYNKMNSRYMKDLDILNRLNLWISSSQSWREHRYLKDYTFLKPLEATVPNKILYSARELFEFCIKIGKFRGSKRHGVLAASVHFAYIKYDQMIQMNELKRFFKFLKQSDISRGIKIVHDIINQHNYIKIDGNYNHFFEKTINRISSSINIEEKNKISKKIKEYFDIIREHKIFNTKSEAIRISIAVYLTLRNFKLNIDFLKIVSDASVTTIKAYLSSINDNEKELLGI